MLKLILPVLFPSWRFFSSIGPSPRIEWGFAAEPNAELSDWLPFRPLPETVGLTAGLLRLLHNPVWNESLYLNTCAEHLFENYEEFYEQEIGRRLLAALASGEISAPATARYLVFRIRAVEAGQPEDEVVFISQAFAIMATGGAR